MCRVVQVGNRWFKWDNKAYMVVIVVDLLMYVPCIWVLVLDSDFSLVHEKLVGFLLEIMVLGLV